MSDGLALSTLDWWSEAGVDVLVDEGPRDWLKPMASASPAPETRTPATPLPELAPAALPADLAGFRAFLLNDASVPGAKASRIDACGDPSTGVIIVVDMPEAEDRTARALLSGEIGALFDRMLGAIQLSRANSYIIPFSSARPIGGAVAKESRATLVRLLDHHLMLASPRKLLLLGDAVAQSLYSLPVTGARGPARSLRVAGRDVPAVVSFPPRLVAPGSAYRAQAWEDLQLFGSL